MAISKLILNGEVQMDVTSDTVSAGNMLSGITGTKKDGTKATGNIATRTSANLTASGSTVTAAAGYYATSVSKSVAAGSAFPPAVTITQNPTFSFVSSTGKITASYTGSSSVTPTVTSGYVTAGTAGTISTTGTSTYTLTTQAAQTLYPSTADQTVASYRWLTGTQTFKSVTTSNLTAENIAEGVVVKVGDSGNASRITQVTGTHSGATTYTATISGSGSSSYCYVTYNGTKYYTNGNTFTFYEGETITVYTRGNSAYTYDYTLPAGNIIIEIAYTSSSNNSINILESIIPINTFNITSNGLYNVYSYSQASVDVTNEYYEIYKACVMAGSLYSSGISNESYKYTSTEVNNFCNSFSTISSRGLEGIGFRGSFYFNNAKSIQQYAFGSAWGGNGVTMYGGLGYFYFPQVSRIDVGAFIFNKNLKHIEASSCTLISNFAFLSCLSLTGISFPNCSTIGYSAFAYCVSLTSINFPECLILSNSAFGNCSGLISISFPKCSIVSYCAFQSCYSLISAIFPECTKVDVGAFSSCSALTTIDFPKCTQIGNYAFAGCSALTTAIFSSCTIIGGYAFNGCIALTTANFPKCTQISNYVFSGCYELSTVSFPSCTTVSYNAFINCSSLEQINLPQCSIIGLSAFSKCTSLRTVSLPICTSIGNNAFNSCYNLISLYLNNVSMVPNIATYTFNSTPISTYSTVAGRYGSVFVPSSLYADFLSHSLWASYSARLVSV